jgi:hypothetical protein
MTLGQVAPNLRRRANNAGEAFNVGELRRAWSVPFARAAEINEVLSRPTPQQVRVETPTRSGPRCPCRAPRPAPGTPSRRPGPPVRERVSPLWVLEPPALGALATQGSRDRS